ncbi:hypothetical protein HHK36_030630 [Tetracentron sinense]|uniref:RING-type domain-containing protein n=1 Tax=Tetracentron sinense TaxID=13715 RepID=A0A834YBE7_TETSI|nr:hypothetical protein HHK36_030630 [Tetracentron sinense]
MERSRSLMARWGIETDFCIPGEKVCSRSFPLESWWTLNTDGSLRENGATLGGIIQGYRGDLCVAFAEGCEQDDIDKLKLSAIVKDLYFMIVTVFSLILLQILSLIRSTSWSLRSSHKRWRATRKYQALIEEKIPTFRYRSESMPELIECAVCLSKFQEGEKIRELKCNHVFHKDCLGKWLQHDSATCPLCRSSVLPEKIGVERRESENEGENDGSDEELIFFLSALHGSSFHRAF